LRSPTNTRSRPPTRSICRTNHPQRHDEVSPPRPAGATDAEHHVYASSTDRAAGRKKLSARFFTHQVFGAGRVFLAFIMAPGAE
jgi:hypothetical protein